MKLRDFIINEIPESLNDHEATVYTEHFIAIRDMLKIEDSPIFEKLKLIKSIAQPIYLETPVMDLYTIYRYIIIKLEDIEHEIKTFDDLYKTLKEIKENDELYEAFIDEIIGELEDIDTLKERY